MINVNIEIRLDLHNLHNLHDEVISQLEEIERRCEFILKKYTWDRKKVYYKNHVNMVQDIRNTLAEVLLKKRYYLKKGGVKCY